MGIAGPDADSIRFPGGKITALMWLSRNMITAEGKLRTGDRVRHVEMDTEILNVGSEIPLPVDSGGMFHITGKFTSVSVSPWAGGIVPSFSRRHIVSCQGISAGPGVLSRIRVCVLPAENKCQDRFGTVLRGAHSQHGRY